MHKKDFQQAYQYFKWAVNHANFEGLLENIKETWIVSEGYLYLIDCLGLLKGDNIVLRLFRINRFYKEIELFSRDKKGMKIPIIILEFVYRIMERHYDYLIDRVEAIDKYRKRHLKEKEVRRSTCLLKMLLQLPKNGFHLAKVKAKANKDLQVLKSIPIELVIQVYEIEIIPYEYLWGLVID